MRVLASRRLTHVPPSLPLPPEGPPRRADAGRVAAAVPRGLPLRPQRARRGGCERASERERGGGRESERSNERLVKYAHLASPCALPPPPSACPPARMRQVLRFADRQFSLEWRVPPAARARSDREIACGERVCARSQRQQRGLRMRRASPPRPPSLPPSHTRLARSLSLFLPLRARAGGGTRHSRLNCRSAKRSTCGRASERGRAREEAGCERFSTKRSLERHSLYRSLPRFLAPRTHLGQRVEAAVEGREVQ